MLFIDMIKKKTCSKRTLAPPLNNNRVLRAETPDMAGLRRPSPTPARAKQPQLTSLLLES